MQLLPADVARPISSDSCPSSGSRLRTRQRVRECRCGIEIETFCFELRLDPGAAVCRYIRDRYPPLDGAAAISAFMASMAILSAATTTLPCRLNGFGCDTSPHCGPATTLPAYPDRKIRR